MLHPASEESDFDGLNTSLVAGIVRPAMALGGVQFGDFDRNGRVDLIDHAEVPNCMTGPAVSTPAGCEVFDVNADGHVDMKDMAGFARVFNGAPRQSSVTEIWVAGGTYVPSKRTDVDDPRSATFSLVDGITLYGGFCGSDGSVDDRSLGSDPECPSVLTGGFDHRNAVAGLSNCCFAAFKSRESCSDTACASLICDDLGFGACCTSNWDEDCARRANVFCAQICSGTGDNAYHVVTASGNDETAVIDGFVISDGVASPKTSVQ